MENNWPETIEELLEECQRLISRYDLYTLGEYGKPFSGEETPRVDGTEYLAGEYQYGVAMIPAQWVRHVLPSATLGSEREKELEELVRDLMKFTDRYIGIPLGNEADFFDAVEKLNERIDELGIEVDE